MSGNAGPRNMPMGRDQLVISNAHDDKDTDATCSIPGTVTALSTDDR